MCCVGGGACCLNGVSAYEDSGVCLNLEPSFVCVVEGLKCVQLAVGAWGIGESGRVWSVMRAVLTGVVCLRCDGFAFGAEVL